MDEECRNFFSFSLALNNFAQVPISHTPADTEVWRKKGGEPGDFNLVSTSSNLKGRRGEGRHCCNDGTETGKYHQSRRILSTMTRGEGGKQTGKREIMCRLIGPGVREPGESRDQGRGRGLFIGHSSESGHGGSGLRLGPKKIGNKVRSRGKLQSFSGRKVPHIGSNWN